MADSSFTDIYNKLTIEAQKKYLISKALGANERQALLLCETHDTTVDMWLKRNEDFVRALDIVKRGEALHEALSLWMGERLPDFLKELEKLATGSNISDKVKLDALKYCISLCNNSVANIEIKKTIMEKYVLDKTEQSVSVAITRGIKND